MTQVILPYRPQPNDPEDVTQIMADFDAITSVVNGGIKNDNIASDAAIAATKISAIPGSQVQITRGTIPPASPNDGDLWQFLAGAAGSGQYWLFRYNTAAVTYKWEFIGGSPLEAEFNGQSVINNAAFTDQGGPKITLPRAGDYDISWGCRVNFSGTVAWSGQMAIQFGAIVVDTTQNAIMGGPNPAGAAATGNMTRSGRYPGRTAAEICNTVYASSGGQGVGFENRWLNVLPVRVS